MPMLYDLFASIEQILPNHLWLNRSFYQIYHCDDSNYIKTGDQHYGYPVITLRPIWMFQHKNHWKYYASNDTFQEITNLWVYNIRHLKRFSIEEFISQFIDWTTFKEYILLQHGVHIEHYLK